MKSISYAGFWLRFLAWAVDTFITMIFIFLFGLYSYSAVAIGYELTESIPFMEFLKWLRLLLMVAIVWLYFALMESSKWQATIGKRIFSIIVTDYHGKRISFPRATGRYFGKILSNATLLIGYVIAGFTTRKQALHDFIAGTIVIKEG
ncbi:MAG: RDD family protein [Candidatus Eremiobacteraeota bacterium]|nr:RDD family protein [Candidatus Eremiobacteraeota bacterium]